MYLIVKNKTNRISGNIFIFSRTQRNTKKHTADHACLNEKFDTVQPARFLSQLDGHTTPCHPDGFPLKTDVATPTSPPHYGLRKLQILCSTVFQFHIGSAEIPCFMHAYHLQNGSYRGYLAQLSFAIIFIFTMIFSVTIFIENPPFFSIFYTPTGIEYTLHGCSIANAIKEDGTPVAKQRPR